MFNKRLYQSSPDDSVRSVEENSEREFGVQQGFACQCVSVLFVLS